METLLTRKEVQSLYRIHRTTLYRWEMEGLRFPGGRIAETELAWWLEQRDAARAIGMDVRVFLAHERPVREKLLAAACETEMRPRRRRKRR